jgi:hypothetical protein
MPMDDHPTSGTILVCDFNGTFREPEMMKPQCVIVLSPKTGGRAKLCTVTCSEPDLRLFVESPMASPRHSDSVGLIFGPRGGCDPSKGGASPPEGLGGYGGLEHTPWKGLEKRWNRQGIGSVAPFTIPKTI